MALSIDDFSISGELPKIPASQHYIFVNDKTGWDALGLYAWGDSELFGAWPGEASVGDSIVGGFNYKVFLLDTNGGNYHLIFNNWNNGLQLPDYDIVADRDYYFTVTAQTVAMRGDVDIDGMVSIADVTALINYLLSGYASGISLEAADCDMDNDVNISDATTLINYLLAPQW